MRQMSSDLSRLFYVEADLAVLGLSPLSLGFPGDSGRAAAGTQAGFCLGG